MLSGEFQEVFLTHMVIGNLGKKRKIWYLRKNCRLTMPNYHKLN
jgi:hypothetical protein